MFLAEIFIDIVIEGNYLYCTLNQIVNIDS